ARLAVGAFGKARFTDEDLRYEVLHYDTGGELGRLESHFRRLAETDRVAAIISTDPNPEAVRLVAELADELEITTFFVADALNASSGVDSPYTYDLSVGGRILIPEVVRVATDYAPMRKIALVSGPGSLYRFNRDEFIRALDAAVGITYIDLEISLTAYDYDSAAYRMLADDIDGIILNGTEDDLVSLLTSCAELTYNPSFVALATAKPCRLELPEYYLLDNGYFVGGYSSESPNAKTTAFVETFRNRIGHIPGPVSAASYDAARIVLRAITAANSPHRGPVAQAIAGFGTHDGVAGGYCLDGQPEWVFIERTVPVATGVNVELATVPPPPVEEIAVTESEAEIGG
ncbi:amino acid ABC transporter substrate-binding protein, partial [bacterium]|nr:amino acid ABC transporter substrate-binding protein [bacterium]